MESPQVIVEQVPPSSDSPPASPRKPRKPRQPKVTKPKLNPLLPERLSAASAERLWCQTCTLYATCATPFLRPYVPRGWTGLLLLIGEAPGEDEDKRTGRPFTGRAGNLLLRLWRTAGYDDRDIALVNAVRCRPVRNATPSMSSVRACRPFLLRAIHLLRPKYVVGLGGTALRALRNDGDNNVTHARGKPLSVPGLESGEGGYRPDNVAITYHPAAILHGATHLEERIVEDLKRIGSNRALGLPTDGIPDSRVLGVDTEWSRGDGRLLTVAISSEHTAMAVEGDFTPVREQLQRAEIIQGHSIAGEVEQLAANGLPVREEWIAGDDVQDSLLIARMADENILKGGYELGTLLSTVATVEDWKKETDDFFEKKGVNKKDRDFADLPSDIRMRRCRLDAWASPHIIAHYLPQLAGKENLIRFTHHIAATLSRLSIAGAFVDMQVYDRLAADLSSEMLVHRDLLTKTAVGAGMTEFVPSNDDHIRELLYDRLGLPVLEKTKTGLAGVAKDVLGQIKDQHPVVGTLMAYNAVEKLYTVNIAGLRDLLHPVGSREGLPVSYLRFNFNPLGAKTGRRSSSDPNSQNWRKSMRAMITSRWPGGKIGDFDYSKLEMVLLAWEAQDDALMHDFTVGGGYIAAARRILGVDVADGTDLYRGIKSIILGVDYRMGTPKMAWELWIKGIRFSDDYDTHVDVTGQYRRKYLDAYPGVERYMARREAEALATGAVVSASGRVRRLPLPDGRDTPGYGRLINQAVNFPIQSFASDVTGAALITIERELLKLHGLSYTDYLHVLLEYRRNLLTQGWNRGIIIPFSVICNEVHDDIVVDLHPDYIKRDTELVVETMRSVKVLRRLVPSFDAPLNVGIQIASHWGAKE